MGLNERLSSLVQEIKGTNEYSALQKTRGVIDKNSVLKNKLMDFNKKQGETFDRNISSKEFEEKAKALDMNYGELVKIKEIDDFMTASRKFDELMEKVFKGLNDSVYS